MSIPVFIDTSDLADEFSLSKQDVEKLLDYTVKEITAEFAQLWSKTAAAELHSSRNSYLKGLIVVDEGLAAGAVVLTGQLNMMIEEGVGAFDIKTGMENSSKRKITTRVDPKTGETITSWYITVPFRLATPDALGESEVFSVHMNDDIYSIVKDLDTTRQVQGGSVSRSLKLDDIPKQYQEPKTRFAVSNIPESKSFEEYKNKHSIYEGLTKVKDGDTGQNRYMSFRRISPNSDPNSWIHSGINAYNLAEKAMSELDIPLLVDQKVDNFLNSLGF